MSNKRKTREAVSGITTLTTDVLEPGRIEGPYTLSDTFSKQKLSYCSHTHLNQTMGGERPLEQKVIKPRSVNRLLTVVYNLYYKVKYDWKICHLCVFIGE